MNELIAILEAEIPANPSSRINEKLADQLEKELRKYFGQIEAMIQPDQIEQIYYRYVKP